jgi:hypothetical protein
MEITSTSVARFLKPDKTAMTKLPAAGKGLDTYSQYCATWIQRANIINIRYVSLYLTSREDI